MAKYALIKNGIVVNIIMADETFIDMIKTNYDAIIDYDEHPQDFSPNDFVKEHENGDLYFLNNPVNHKDKFVSPEEEFIDAELVVKEIDAPTEAKDE